MRQRVQERSRDSRGVEKQSKEITIEYAIQEVEIKSIPTIDVNYFQFRFIGSQTSYINTHAHLAVNAIGCTFIGFRDRITRRYKRNKNPNHLDKLSKVSN